MKKVEQKQVWHKGDIKTRSDVSSKLFYDGTDVLVTSQYWCIYLPSVTCTGAARLVSVTQSFVAEAS